MFTSAGASHYSSLCALYKHNNKQNNLPKAATHQVMPASYITTGATMASTNPNSDTSSNIDNSSGIALNSIAPSSGSHSRASSISNDGFTYNSPSQKNYYLTNDMQISLYSQDILVDKILDAVKIVHLNLDKNLRSELTCGAVMHVLLKYDNNEYFSKNIIKQLSDELTFNPADVQIFKNLEANKDEFNKLIFKIQVTLAVLNNDETNPTLLELFNNILPETYGLQTLNTLKPFSECVRDNFRAFNGDNLKLETDHWQPPILQKNISDIASIESKINKFNPQRLSNKISADSSKTYAEHYIEVLSKFYTLIGFANKDIPQKIIDDNGKLNSIVGRGILKYLKTI